MARCIYCLKDDTESAFTKREHVIPSCLGSFVPLNPTLTAAEGVVCDTCNGEVFSPLEVIFREDSYEGVYGQRLNLQGRNSVTMRGNNFKVESLSGFGDKFFGEMYLFLKVDEKQKKVVPELRDQIKLRRFRGGFRVFLPEALERIRDGSREFERVAHDLQNLDKKDMSIFAENREAIDRIIALLHRFGVPYKEKESKYRKFEKGDKLDFHEKYTCTITHDIGRVLVKTAFNYFAYCMIQSGKKDLLYTNHFNAARTFVQNDSGITLQEIIPSCSEEPILWEERERGRLLGHIINFRQEEGRIVCRLTFFGLPAVYKIIVGTIPDALRDDGFGCGHVFDFIGHKIMNISQTSSPEHPTEEQLRTTFGVLKRL